MIKESGRCEYDPATKAAAHEGDGCANRATVSIAHGMWHLCAQCAALPEFRKYRRREAIGAAAVVAP